MLFAVPSKAKRATDVKRLTLTDAVTRNDVDFEDGHAVPCASFRSAFQQNLQTDKHKFSVLSCWRHYSTVEVF